MPSDTYILTISEAGVSVPSSHASTHITGGSDVIPTATSSTSGLMSAAIFTQHGINTDKVSNITHTGDVTDTAGVLTVGKINGVSMAGLATGILKNTTSTGVPSIAVAADFPTLNQNTTGNAATATTATTATNIAGGAVGAVPYQSASGTTALLSAGTSGFVLKSNGSSAPSWVSVTDVIPTLNQNTTGNAATATLATTATNIAGGAAGAVPYQSASGTTALLSAGTSGFVLKSNGSSAPSWVSVTDVIPTLNQSTTGNANTATTATTATNLAGGGVGQVPYQTGSGATAMLAAGTAGYVLKSNGSAAPSWGQVNLSSETTGTLPVSGGGSGATTFTAGVLKANGTSAFTTVAAPTGDLVGTTDIQTLTNKTFGTNTTFSTAIGVASGGTGAATFTSGILRANGTSAFTTVAAPTGTIVGTTDTQTLTNKTFGTGTVFSTTITAANGGTGQSSYTVGDILFADTSSTLSKLSSVATGNALISGGAGVAPLYGKIGLTTHVSGTLPVANGGTGVTTSTGTGANVLSTSPTLVTPALGTPTSGVLTSCTGLPLTTGVTGTLPVANGGTGVTTSTGTGANVLSTSPVLVTPQLGTPTSGILTSCTGLPLTTGVTGILPIANGGTGYGVDGIGTLTFDTTPDTGTVLTEGQLRWNSTDKTLDLKMAGTAVTQQIGQELLMRVHSASAISNGQVVYISGSNSGLPSVTVASANSINARKTLGVATEDIAAGSDGYIALSGLVRGLNLSTYSAGQELWLANSGNFTGTEAAYPDYKIRIGFVVLNTDGDGSFFVAPKFFENGYVNGTGKIGYITGAGGTVTQSTSKLTSVTLDKTTGQIIMNNAALAANTTVSFTFTNSKIEAGDVLILNHISGGTNFGSYLLNARTSAGSAIIDIRNITSGSLSESIVIAFALIKSVVS